MGRRTASFVEHEYYNGIPPDPTSLFYDSIMRLMTKTILIVWQTQRPDPKTQEDSHVRIILLFFD